MIQIRITRECRFKYSPDTFQPYFWEWLVENFGYPGICKRWYFDSNVTVTFINDQDATAFTIVWASDIVDTARIS